MTDIVPCPQCFRPMRVRSNKKFCSSSCRSRYHAEAARKALAAWAGSEAETTSQCDAGIIVDLQTGWWTVFVTDAAGHRTKIGSYATLQEARTAIKRAGVNHDRTAR